MRASEEIQLTEAKSQMHCHIWDAVFKCHLISRDPSDTVHMKAQQGRAGVTCRGQQRLSAYLGRAGWGRVDVGHGGAKDSGQWWEGT
jgi:hypothetical protein